jgi:hypothetical protein
MKSVEQAHREKVMKVKDESKKPSSKQPKQLLDNGRRNEVARKAYELFERRGGVHGHDLEDWLEAEQLVPRR